MNMNTIATHALNLTAYLLLTTGFYFLLVLGLDSHLMAEMRANGNYTAANIFFFSYFLKSILALSASFGSRHYAKKLQIKEA